MTGARPATVSTRVTKLLVAGIRLVAARRMRLTVREDHAWALAQAGSVKKALDLLAAESSTRVASTNIPLLPGASARVAMATAAARVRGVTSASSGAEGRVRKSLIDAEEKYAYLALAAAEAESRAKRLLDELEEQNHDYKKFFVRIRALRQLHLTRLGSEIYDESIRSQTRALLDNAYAEALRHAARVLDSSVT